VDHDLFAAINGLAGRERVVDTLSVALSRFGPYLLLVALGIVWFQPAIDAERERRRRRVLLSALAAAGSLFVNQIIIRIWSRPRPSAVTLLLPPSLDPSFPSDHATFAFGIATGLLLVSKGVGVPALILAALIGLSRVYTGEHYLSDVIGGALIGSGAALAAARARGLLEPLLARALRLARWLHLA
jgi:undecaprenyl-diphosphatase